MRPVVLVLLLGSLMMPAQEACLVAYTLMYALAQKEGHAKRPVGYPYLISFNRKEDAGLAGSIFPKEGWIDRRTYDCGDERFCIAALEALDAYGIDNVDLGAFSINAHWWPDDPSVYFDLGKSYKKACEITEENARRYGWSWETLGRYHIAPEADQKRNESYYRDVMRLYVNWKEGAIQ